MYNLIYNKLSFRSIIDNVKEEGISLYRKGFCDLFTYECVPDVINDIRVMKYEFYLKPSLNNLCVMKIIVNENDELVSYDCVYDRNDIKSHCKHLIAFVKYIEDENIVFDTSIINSKFEKIEEQIYLKKIEDERKNKLVMFNSLISYIDKVDLLPLKDKVSLECLFKYNNMKVILELKIGLDKKYIIQNLNTFFNAIVNKSTLLYGKKFSFAHELNNFDETSQKIIKLLLPVYRSSLMSNRSMELTPMIFEEMININKGKYVYFDFSFWEDNYQYYYLSNKEYKPSLYLNDDYELVITGFDHFIPCFTKDYVFVNNMVMEVKYDSKSFQEFVRCIVFQGNKYSFLHIEDVFENEVYPRYSKFIKINEKIKNHINTIEYSIRLYIDSNNDIISSRMEYYNNNECANETECKSIGYKIKKVKTMLLNLGFDENGNILKLDRAYNFLRTDLSELRSLCEIFLSENVKRLEVKTMKPLITKVSYETNMMKIFFEKSEYSDEELALIIKSLKKNIRFIKLNSDTIIEVKEEEANKILNTIESFNLDYKHLTKAQEKPLYHVLKVVDDKNLLEIKLDEALKDLVSKVTNFKDLDYTLPDNLDKVMRSYQKDAFKWMKTLKTSGFGGILADDMGLGKTLEVISLIYDESLLGPCLIVCPKSLCYNWKNEFNMWTSEIKVVNVIGSTLERESIIKSINSYNPREKIVYISSYDSLRNDISLYNDIDFNYLILDEAQSIKNHETLKAKSVRIIRAKHRFVLTGTPIENGVNELWSIFDFLMPGYLGSYNNFKEKYQNKIAEEDAETMQLLIKKISPFVLRRTKKKVLKDLPDKVEIIQNATMNVHQKKIYDAYIKKIRDAFQNKVSRIDLLAGLTRLRQICVDPNLFVPDYKGSSSKIELLFELINDYVARGHKIIVFSQFSSIFDSISEKLNSINVKHFILTGKTMSEERVTMSKIFNDEKDDHKVFLVSLKAGGTGLNLTGGDIVIHLDPWWNYAVESQATDRAHRIGQTKVVQVIKIICENTIEEKVLLLQKMKKDAAEKIIQSDDANYVNISLSDIKYLLE